MSIQRITGERGEWLVAVARHSAAETFTFDITASSEYVAEVDGYEGRTAICCHNMTRADLLEHVRNCQAALDEVPS